MIGIVSKLYRNLILEPLGLDTQNAIVFWLIVLLGGTTLFGLWFFEGDILLTMLTVLWLAILLLTVFRIDYSLLLLISAVLLSDQFAVVNSGFDIYQTAFFKNLNEISSISGLTYGYVSLLDLQIISIVFALFLWMTTKRDYHWQSLPVGIPFLLVVLSILGATVYGAIRGEDILSSFNESRSLIYFLFFYLFAAQIIRTKRHVKIFMWIVIAAITAQSGEFLYRYFAITESPMEWQALMGPELPYLLIVILFFLLSLWVIKAKDVQKVWLLFSLPLFLFPLFLGANFSIYAVLLVILIIFPLLLSIKPLFRYLAVVVPCLLGVLIYTLVYLDYHEIFTRPEGVFQSLEAPIEEIYQNIQDVFYADESSVSSTDFFAAKTIFGVGFGSSNDLALSDNPSSISARNNLQSLDLLSLIPKVGVLGFLMFWFFFSSYIANAVKVLKGLRDLYLQAVVILAVVSCTAFLGLSFFAPQFSYFRTMIFLGSMMGILAATLQISSDESRKELDDLTEKE